MSLAEQYMHREFRRIATQYIMKFYDISEEGALKLYKDEIEAAEKLMKYPEIRQFMKGKNNE